MENNEMSDEEYYEVLCQNSKRVIDEINLLPVSNRIKTNIDDFLNYDGIAGKKVRPYKSYFINGKAGIWFDLDDNGYCYILFGDDDTWEWKIEAYVRDNDGIVYKKEMSHSGSRDILFDNKDGTTTPLFIFHDEPLKLITLPDKFSKEWLPRLDKKAINIFWETDRYDGMLTGYGIYNNKIVFVKCIDETFFERDRMFAVYQLSLLERIMMCFNKRMWSIVSTSRFIWAGYMFIYRLKNNLGLHKSVKQILDKNDKFTNSHKILGYYVW